MDVSSRAKRSRLSTLGVKLWEIGVKRVILYCRRVFWLQRDLSLLPVDGRPLSKSNKLEAMYQIRRPRYEAFADHMVQNDTDPDSAARLILRIWEEDK